MEEVHCCWLYLLKYSFSLSISSTSSTKVYIEVWLVNFHFACYQSAILANYRHTSFYCASLYCTLQIRHFLQLEGLWQPCVEPVYWHHFSNSICSLRGSVSHFGNSCNISDLFLLWWSVISDLWCSYCKKITAHWKFRWWLAFFRNKVFLKLRYVLF